MEENSCRARANVWEGSLDKIVRRCVCTNLLIAGSGWGGKPKKIKRIFLAAAARVVRVRPKYNWLFLCACFSRMADSRNFFNATGVWLRVWNDYFECVAKFETWKFGQIILRWLRGFKEFLIWVYYDCSKKFRWLNFSMSIKANQNICALVFKCNSAWQAINPKFSWNLS